MRIIALALAAASALALSACNTTGPIPSPGTVADKTKADEQLGLAMTLAYTAAARAAALAIQAGIIKDSATIQRIGQLDNKAYAAVQAARAAYLGANASTYEGLVQQANAAIADLSSMSGAKPVSFNLDRASPATAAATVHAQLQAGA